MRDAHSTPFEARWTDVGISTDNTPIAQSLRLSLADGGWRAVETYENSPAPVDLLLTDVIMPDLTGPVVAERLRAKQPDLQVLFISGYHDADLVQRFVRKRGFTLLPKPFTVEGLLRGVEESLSGVKR